MFIQEVEIYKILGCESVQLFFTDTKRSPVYVVQSVNGLQQHNILSLAVQLLCSSKYSHLTSLEDPELKGISQGGVRLKFIIPLSTGQDMLDAVGIQFDDVGFDYPLEEEDDEEFACGDAGRDLSTTPDALDSEMDMFGPSTSSEARAREMAAQHGRNYQHHSSARGRSVKKFLLINAYRDFRINPEEVYYSINDGPKESCSLAAFHGRFYICMDYMLPQLENLNSKFSGDWLEILVSDLNEKWNRREQLYDPFERFFQLFRKYGYPERHFLPQMTRTTLMSKDTMHTMQKTYIIKILRDTRGIFEFITAGEYTVWFYIPHYGRYADAISQVMVEDLNFQYMVTYVENTSQLTKRVWTEAPKAIKDLLLVSFQLSLGFHCKQQIIYLQNFNEICQYQAIQLASSAHWQKLGVLKSDWTCKNYLQRIVDVCVNCGTTAIIEYPGGIPLHPVNAYMIKIFQYQEEERSVIDMKIINNEQYSFEYFLDCLKDGLKLGDS